MKTSRSLLFLLLALFGCKDCSNDPSPSGTRPQPTTDGRNTFYCEINGKPYYQRFTGGQPTYPQINGSYSDQPDIKGINFTITYPNGNATEIIKFSYVSLVKPGSLRFPSDSSYYIYYHMKNACDYYNTKYIKTQNGIIEFSRYDYTSGIFSGEFNLTMWLPDSISNGCDTLKITNGIFDIKL